MPLKLTLAIAAFMAAAAASAPTVDAAPPPQPGAVAKAKAAITATMRDPNSTQFRDVKLGGTCGTATYVTGWANGKNGYGGYGGFKIFMVRVEGGRATVMQAEGAAMASTAEFQAAANCNGDGPK